MLSTRIPDDIVYSNEKEFSRQREVSTGAPKREPEISARDCPGKDQRRLKPSARLPC